MGRTILVAVATSLITAALTVLAIEAPELRPEVASSDALAQSVAGEDGEIKGDVDCNLAIETADVLKLLLNIAGLDYTQSTPCTPIGDLIPLGEPIPGPQGPAGPQGPVGPQGPAGQQGGPGISGWEIVEVQGVLGSAEQNVVVVECPAGKKPLGGGALINDTVDRVAIVSSVPTGSGWTGVGREMAPTDDLWAVYTYAICALVED